MPVGLLRSGAWRALWLGTPLFDFRHVSSRQKMYDTDGLATRIQKCMTEGGSNYARNVSEPSALFRKRKKYETNPPSNDKKIKV